MNRYKYRYKPKKCPACKSSRVATIMYGMPDYSHQLQKKIDDGKIVLGGCVILMDAPIWQCADCGTDFFRKPLPYDGPGFPPIVP